MRQEVDSRDEMMHSEMIYTRLTSIGWGSQHGVGCGFGGLPSPPRGPDWEPPEIILIFKYKILPSGAFLAP